MEVVLHLKWCQRECDTYLDLLIQRLAKPLFVFSHVAFHLSTASVVCRIDSARFGCNKYCIRTRWRPFFVAVTCSVQSSPRFKSIVDFGVLHGYQCASLAQQCQGQVQLSSVLLKLCCTTAAAVILASCIAAQRSASIDLGFAEPMYEMTTLANLCAHQ